MQLQQVRPVPRRVRGGRYDGRPPRKRIQHIHDAGVYFAAFDSCHDDEDNVNFVKKKRRMQFKFLQEGQPQNGSGQYAQVFQKNISFQRILLETILLIFHTRTPAIPLISLLVPTG